MYCRNCGISSTELELDMSKVRPFWQPDLCLACHHKPIIGYHYNYLSGTHLPRETITTFVTQKQEQQQDEPYQLLTFNEAMNYLKVSRSTMYRLLKDGSLKGCKVGNGVHWRFTVGQLKEVLK